MFVSLKSSTHGTSDKKKKKEKKRVMFSILGSWKRGETRRES